MTLKQAKCKHTHTKALPGVISLWYKKTVAIVFSARTHLFVLCRHNTRQTLNDHVEVAASLYPDDGFTASGLRQLKIKGYTYKGIPKKILVIV